MEKTMYINGVNDTKVELTDLVLKKDKDGIYYLGAKYRVEDDKAVREVHIPKILLTVNRSNVTIRRDDCYREDFIHISHPEVDIGFGYLPLCIDDPCNMTYFTETVIEEKIHELTLDEIEKKLGYKVKIVNK